MRTRYLFVFCLVFFYTSLQARQDVEQNDSTVIVNLLHDASELFDIQPNSSLELAKEARQLALNIRSNTLQLRAERTLGYFYTQLGEYDLASEHYFKSLDLNGTKNAIAAAIFDRLGEIMRQNGSFDDAYKYHKKSLQIHYKANDSMGLAYTFNSIGLVHELIEDFDSALFYHHKSLLIKEAMGNISGMADSYSNMGTIYRRTGDLEKALEMQLKTLDIDLEQGDKINIAITHNNLAVLYMDLDELDRAALHLNKALHLASKAKARDINKYANQQLSVLQEKLGDYKKAYNYFKTYTVLKDSLFNEDKSKEIGKLEARHEFESAEIERKKLEEERRAASAKAERRRNNLQYSGILIFIVLLFAGVFELGRFSIPVRLAEGMIFFSFLLFFEFTLVLLDPYIERYSSGAPAIKLAFNAVLAGLIFPLHAFFEGRLKKNLAKHK